MRNPDALECIELIVPLCRSVADRITRYSMTEESVASNQDHLDLLLMPIFQIGELIGAAGNYESLQELYPSNIWFQAYGLRNRIAHGYAKLKPTIIWQTATVSIPELLELCLRLLEGDERQGDSD